MYFTFSITLEFPRKDKNFLFDIFHVDVDFSVPYIRFSVLTLYEKTGKISFSFIKIIFDVFDDFSVFDLYLFSNKPLFSKYFSKKVINMGP